MATPRRVHKTLERLAALEEGFLRREFLAPVLRGAGVQVRIAGVVCRLRVAPPHFQGWGVCRPVSYTAARLARPATLAERQRHLELFPRVRLILGMREGGHWFGTAAHRGDARLRLSGPVPVRLVEGARLFEVVQARCDGAQFWFEGPDPRRDPAAAAYLRQALQDMVEPDKLQRPALTAEERDAYAQGFWRALEAGREARRGRTETRLRQALGHAGAGLKDYLEREDCYQVEYEVDGATHVCVVSKQDLSVQAAGICLSGADALFDLHSLVGVLREAREGAGV
jgi:hypothetical protein